MKLGFSGLSSVGASIKFFQDKFGRIPLSIGFNVLTAIALSILSIYAKVEHKGYGIEYLFSDPFEDSIPYLGWFTGISEILWCGAIAICFFTIGLLPKLDRRFAYFLLASALLMLLLFFDDRFRLTLILGVLFGHSQLIKLTIYSLYGGLLILYVYKFWQIIRNTPYLPLLISFGLFAVSSAADVTPFYSRGFQAMLEDGTKLLGLINLSLYFWYICHQQISKYLTSR